MTGIHDLQTELIEVILIYSTPQDVGAFAQTCRAFHTLVYEPADDHLWRSLYLVQPLDDPRKCVSSNFAPRLPHDIKWMKELQQIIRAEAILKRHPRKCRGREERIAIMKTLLHLIEYTPVATDVEAFYCHADENGLQGPLIGFGPHEDASYSFTAAELSPRSLNLVWVKDALKPGTFLDFPDLFDFPDSPRGPPRATPGAHEIGSFAAVKLSSAIPGGIPIPMTRSRAKHQSLQKFVDSEDDEELQLRARLHTYYGVTQEDLKPERRVQSRAYAYSMRKYGWYNRFGPFLPLTDEDQSRDLTLAPDEEGDTTDAPRGSDAQVRVNWVHVEALHHVISMHILGPDTPPGAAPAASGNADDGQFKQYMMSLQAMQNHLPDPSVDVDELGRQGKDWLGIEGIWSCSFCFCDHRELLLYNQLSIRNPVTLSTALFERPDFEELFRSPTVVLKVTSTRPDPLHPNRPKIYFCGQMGSQHSMTGWVQMTVEGYVQWHFISGEEGNAVWSSEGIQVGGIRSGFGVLGAWTTVFHDDDDPVGPFWFRKLTVSPEQEAQLLSAGLM